jgi:mono/diheme cytochrome c family protein
MKKIAIILIASIAIASCNKKASPASSNTGTTNTSGVAATASNNVNTPAVAVETKATTPVAVNTNADVVSQAAKTTKEPGQLSPEQQGQATYNAKCGKCHGLKVTTDYTSDRWITVMQVMAPKARLSDVEKENVLAYVKANAKK